MTCILLCSLPTACDCLGGARMLLSSWCTTRLLMHWQAWREPCFYISEHGTTGSYIWTMGDTLLYDSYHRRLELKIWYTKGCRASSNPPGLLIANNFNRHFNWYILLLYNYTTLFCTLHASYWDNCNSYSLNSRLTRSNWCTLFVTFILCTVCAAVTKLIHNFYVCYNFLNIFIVASKSSRWLINFYFNNMNLNAEIRTIKMSLFFLVINLQLAYEQWSKSSMSSYFKTLTVLHCTRIYNKKVQLNGNWFYSHKPWFWRYLKFYETHSTLAKLLTIWQLTYST